MKNNQTKSNRGGKREGAGRKAGVPNKVGADLRELAQQYTEEALEALVGVLREGGDAAKVAASRELLDRGHGKASQIIAGDPNAPLLLQTITHKVIDAHA